jgi:hypothetical protein
VDEGESEGKWRELARARRRWKFEFEFDEDDNLPGCDEDGSVEVRFSENRIVCAVVWFVEAGPWGGTGIELRSDDTWMFRVFSGEFELKFSG